MTLGNSATYTYTGNYVKVDIDRGIYRFECWGAQGGTGCINGKLTVSGGNGAYTSGIITIGYKTSFYLYVGGKGGYPSCSKNAYASGGWNGGGYGGIDTRDDDPSGGGGGATDIRLISGSFSNTNSLRSRIMVAAGGSGSTYGSYGAPGGDLNGYDKTGTGINSIKTTSTSQTSGNSFGIGGNGDSHKYTPSSGGGGGYYGGYSNSGIQSPTYKAVSHSGSSYISGHKNCNSVSSTGSHTNSPYHYSGFSFINTTMINGVNLMPYPFGSGTMYGKDGDGAIRITFISHYITHNPVSYSDAYRSIIGIVLLLFV